MIDSINRWLQHITTWRYADDHARWHSGPMLADLYEGMDAFIDGLDELASPLLETHSKVRDLLLRAGLLDA